MNHDFTGKVMMFKSLKIRDTETLSDFHRVPDNLNLAQGIDLLRNWEPGKDVVAQVPPAAQNHSQQHK